MDTSTPTNPPESPDPATDGSREHTGGPRVSADEVRDVSRLRRSRSDRPITGLCAGIARHLDIDPLLVRVLMVVLVFFGGAGLLIYLGGWLLVPEEGDESRPLGLDDRSRGIALLALLAIAGLAVVGDVSSSFWFPWPLVLIGLGLAFLVDRTRRPRGTAPGQPPGAPARPDTSGWDPGWETGQPLPPDPRRRGPLLFLPTLALSALGVGVLGVVDVAGADVPASGYPALVLATTALALVVGAFWGRAGGLIALGVLLLPITAATTAADEFAGEDIRATPTEAGQVLDDYRLEAGEMVVDLSGVGDVDELDGRRVEITGGVGRIEVVLPEGMDVPVTASVGGPGNVQVLDRQSDGMSPREEGFLEGGDEAPDLRIDVDLGVGEVVVRTADQTSRIDPTGLEATTAEGASR